MATTKKTTKPMKLAAKPATSLTSGKRALQIATDKAKSTEERLTALAQSPSALVGDDESLESVLAILRDVKEPAKLRMAAMNSLQAASFSVVTFRSCQNDYRLALRKVAQDGNPELRQRALGLLARQKDPFAQKRLLEGLQDSTKALVPPEQALQLLSYDAHAGAYQAARAIVDQPTNPETKTAALRLLATDTNSVPLFEKVLLDKNELRQNRQVSASALHALDPEKMQALARNIVLDTGDYDDIKATSLTALTEFGDESTLSEDKTLWQGVNRLKTKGSPKLKLSAIQFLSKTGQ